MQLARIGYDRAMLSVVLPTLNAAPFLPGALSALVPAVLCGLIKDVVVADGGSTDATFAIADAMGANVVPAPRGRGPQLVAGAKAARGEWLLFLHADTVLAPGWEEEVQRFLGTPNAAERAAVFRLAFDDFAPAARRIERLAERRARWLGLPYGDQGLLIHRSLYDCLGGYRPLALMEDVDLVRRIGRRRLVFLRTAALTSAARYQDSGYAARGARNLLCLSLFYLRVPSGVIARLYG